MPPALSRATRLLGGLALIALAGCLDATGNSGSLRIRIVNAATGVAVRVVVDGPRFSAVTLDVGVGATVNTYPTGGQGDPITFTVTVPSNLAITGEGSCTAGIPMSPGSSGDTHGQVNLILEGQSIRVECSGAGLPGSGWE